MERIGIVGTGVAGLACAWNLRNHAALTLLEKDVRPGGHTNTVTVEEDGRPVPIDTGFIVFNKVTYPNLCRLFEDLEVAIKPSEMSFSVQHAPTGLEYNGMGVNKVFAQRRNLFRPRFHQLLSHIQKFFRVAKELLDSPAVEDLQLGEFVKRHDLSQDFLDLYLVPMSSAVWSTEPGDILGFPASTLIRFFHNHGFLGVDTHHPWFTVDGGAKTYVDKILASLGAPRLSSGVTRVEETSSGVAVTTASGDTLTFDRVVLACHADQSLALLASPDASQRRLLAPFRYQKNRAILHTDESVMPKKRLAWASWNYRVTGGLHQGATTHYWMNALQGVSHTRNYFVSLNTEIAPEKIFYETTYEHPIFTLDAIRAQASLPWLNTHSPNQRIFFCGSYFKYGFHEDACTSGLQAAEALHPLLASKASFSPSH
jgi:predicted NAD/FAD-binding protein